MDIRAQIVERFNVEETKQDKKYFLDEISRQIKYLYQELEGE